MPQQLITGTDCCPCACSDTVTFIQNITNGGQVVSGQGDPVDAPADQSLAAVYYDRDSGNQWGWDTATLAWIPLAGGTGGTQQVFHYQGNPATFPAPTNPNLPAVNYDDSQAGIMSLWNTATQSWY